MNIYHLSVVCLFYIELNRIGELKSGGVLDKVYKELMRNPGCERKRGQVKTVTLADISLLIAGLYLHSIILESWP